MDDFGMGIFEPEMDMGTIAEDEFIVDTLLDNFDGEAGGSFGIFPLEGASVDVDMIAAPPTAASTAEEANIPSSTSTVSSGSEAAPMVETELAPIRTRNGDVLCFETFQGKIDIGKCVRMSLNSLNLGVDGAMLEDGYEAGRDGGGPAQASAISVSSSSSSYSSPLLSYETGAAALTPSLSSSSLTQIVAPSSSAMEKKKRPRKPNPDSELISQATEQTLALMKLDPNSKEGKKQRRRIRNQMSAQLHRERKKQYIEALEDCIRDRDVQIRELEEKLRQATAASRASRDSSLETSNSSSSSVGTGSTTQLSDESDNESSWTTSPLPLGGEGDEFKTSLPRKHRRTGEAPSEGSSFNARAGLTLFSTALLGMSLLNNMPSLGGRGGAAVDVNLGDAGDWFATSDKEAAAITPMLSLPPSPTSKAKNMKPSNILGSSNSHSVVKYQQDWTDPKSDLWSLPKADLWKYEEDDAVARLFPTETINATDASITMKKRVKIKRRGNLRSGADVEEEKKESSHMSATALVPVVPSWLETQEAASRVLMTNGRALLDPSFLDRPHLYRAASTSTENFHDSRSHPEESQALAAWMGKQQEQHQQNKARPAGPVVRVHTSMPTEHDAVNAGGDQSLMSAPQLVMMLPASAVRWGSSWSEHEDKDGSFASILKELNDTDETVGTTAPHGESDDLWVEISCSVFKAQLVKNVNTAV